MKPEKTAEPVAPHDPMRDPLRRLHAVRMAGATELETDDPELLQHAELAAKIGLTVRKPGQRDPKAG